MIVGEANIEKWPLKEPFVISRGRRTHAEVVCLRVSDGSHSGWGECQPNIRYEETLENVAQQLTACFPASMEELENLADTLPSMAARNALDCALWDLKCKRADISAANMLRIDASKPVPTYFTLSVAEPEEMAASAKRWSADGVSRFKLKLAGEADGERLRAVRAAVPDASLIVDANEAWSLEMLYAYIPVLETVGVDLLEQPLPAGNDELLREIDTPVTICADESCHVASDLADLLGKYDAVNIKLDKTGGLTPALELFEQAKQHDFEVMVGCMLGTSLAVSPAMLIAAQAEYVDLDAPLLLSQDRNPALKTDDRFNFLGLKSELWG